MTVAPLEPNREQLAAFVNAIFKYAGTAGYVSIRAFYEGADKTFRKTGTALTGGLDFIIEVAEDDARRAAHNPQPVVFCPPLAVFNNKETAREEDVVLGPALSTECDANPAAAREALERILGPATVVVKSGGIWTNGSGAVADKLHLHWRLAAPASDAATLKKLKQARALATAIVGGDPTNNPVCHPIRWPGSWHRKAEPRLCEIIALNEEVEIDLDDALAKLKAAAPDVVITQDRAPGDQPQADTDEIAAAVAVIPNTDLNWDGWNNWGMAIWRATSGSEAGFTIFDAFSRKSAKYDAANGRLAFVPMHIVRCHRTYQQDR